MTCTVRTATVDQFLSGGGTPPCGKPATHYIPSADFKPSYLCQAHAPTWTIARPLTS